MSRMSRAGGRESRVARFGPARYLSAMRVNATRGVSPALSLDAA
jgi:hypothetical protein